MLGGFHFFVKIGWFRLFYIYIYIYIGLVEIGQVIKFLFFQIRSIIR
jgi:hypothetical protein